MKQTPRRPSAFDASGEKNMQQLGELSSDGSVKGE